MEASTVVCVRVQGMHTYSVTYTISQCIRVCVCVLHGQTLFSATAFVQRSSGRETSQTIE